MSRGTVDNVTAGKPGGNGCVFVAPLGSTLPTDAETALDAAFASLGFVSTDGIRNTNSPSAENVKAYGGDVVLTLQTEKPDTFQFTLMEVKNVDVLKFVYGSDNVTGTLATGITVNATSDEARDVCLVFEHILRGGVKKRVVVPDAKITSVGEIALNDTAASGYDVTVTAFVDTNGKTHYEYLKQ